MGLFLSPSVFYKYGETLVKIYTIIPIVLLLYVAEACCWHCSRIQILHSSLAFRLDPAWEELFIDIHTIHPLLQYQSFSGKTQWPSLRWFRVKTWLGPDFLITNPHSWMLIPRLMSKTWVVAWEGEGPYWLHVMPESCGESCGCTKDTW